MIMVKFNPIIGDVSRFEALKHFINDGGRYLQRAITRVFVGFDTDLNEAFRRACRTTINDRTVKILGKDWVFKLFVGREAVYNLNEYEKWRREYRDTQLTKYTLLNEESIEEYHKLEGRSAAVDIEQGVGESDC